MGRLHLIRNVALSGLVGLAALVGTVAAPAEPVSAQWGGFTACDVWDVEYFWQGSKVTAEDNTDSWSLTATAYSDRKPTGPVSATAWHVFTARPDTKVGSGIATWEEVWGVESNGVGTHYQLTWRGSVSKKHDSFKGRSDASVRIVFSWNDRGTKREVQSCPADLTI